MRISYQYKIKPTKNQREAIDNTLEMLRYQYNYLLAQRFDWYEQNRCSIDRCSLVCYLPELKEQPNYYSQKASLTQLKKDRPWYKNIHSQVLQEVPKKVELTFDRWLKGDCNGKKSGRPRFKAKGRYRTFTYPQFKQHQFAGNPLENNGYIIAQSATHQYVVTLTQQSTSGRVGHTPCLKKLSQCLGLPRVAEKPTLT